MEAQNPRALRQPALPTSPLSGPSRRAILHRSVADVALISVITSGTVGVLGAAGAIYGQRVSIRLDKSKRQDAWRDDIRSVLDDAAKCAMVFNLPTNTESRAGDVAFELENLRVEMEKQLGRLGVRLGPEATVYQTYAEIRDAVQSLADATSDLPSDTILNALKDHAQALQEPIEQAVQALTDMETAIQQFLAAAAELTGRWN